MSTSEPIAPAEPINPFLFVWVNPRRALRSFLTEGQPRLVLPLLTLAILMSVFAEILVGERSAALLILIGIPIALAYAAIIYFVYAYVLNFVCHSLRGLGELHETRAALAWSWYVRAGTTLLMTVALLLAGSATATAATNAVDSPVVVFVGYGLGFATGVYNLVITTLLISEAHQFEWWKGLLSAILTRILTGLLLFLVMLPISMALVAMGA